MTVAQALTYRGTPMRSELHQPDRDLVGLGAVRIRLLRRQAQYGSLRPGDGTRYDVVLTPIEEAGGQRGLVVTRLRGGDVVASAVLWDWDEGASEHQISEAADALSDGNDWTAELFRWWLTLLCT